MSILDMRGVCKAFDGVPVLKNVNLSVEKGEIHALLGENGAGKSTLMNILTGVVPMDAGEIAFDGRAVAQPSVTESERMGIAFVHQELNLFLTMKVSFRSKVLSWFGEHVFSIYILQRIPMILLSRSGLAAQNRYGFILGVLVITMFLALVFDYLVGKLDQQILKWRGK